MTFAPLLNLRGVVVCVSVLVWERKTRVMGVGRRARLPTLQTGVTSIMLVVAQDAKDGAKSEV